MSYVSIPIKKNIIFIDSFLHIKEDLMRFIMNHIIHHTEECEL
jgi:hypothetical protein